MDLVSRFTWLIITTVILTTASIVILLLRRYTDMIYRYNAAILGLIGLEADQPRWLQWLAAWLLSSGMATVLMVLVINIVDSLQFLTGFTGISLDPHILPLVFGGLLLSCLLLLALIPSTLAVPPASPTAFTIFTILHLYEFRTATALAIASNFFFFCVLVIGVMGTALSVFLLFRQHLVAPLVHRRQRTKTS